MIQSSPGSSIACPLHIQTELKVNDIDPRIRSRELLLMYTEVKKIEALTSALFVAALLFLVLESPKFGLGFVAIVLTRVAAAASACGVFYLSEIEKRDYDYLDSALKGIGEEDQLTEKGCALLLTLKRSQIGSVVPSDFYTKMSLKQILKGINFAQAKLAKVESISLHRARMKIIEINYPYFNPLLKIIFNKVIEFERALENAHMGTSIVSLLKDPKLCHQFIKLPSYLKVLIEQVKDRIDDNQYLELRDYNREITNQMRQESDKKMITIELKDGVANGSRKYFRRLSPYCESIVAEAGSLDLRDISVRQFQLFLDLVESQKDPFSWDTIGNLIGVLLKLQMRPQLKRCLNWCIENHAKSVFYWVVPKNAFASFKDEVREIISLLGTRLVIKKENRLSDYSKRIYAEFDAFSDFFKHVGLKEAALPLLGEKVLTQLAHEHDGLENSSFLLVRYRVLFDCDRLPEANEAIIHYFRKIGERNSEYNLFSFWDGQKKFPGWQLNEFLSFCLTEEGNQLLLNQCFGVIPQELSEKLTAHKAGLEITCSSY